MKGDAMKKTLWALDPVGRRAGLALVAVAALAAVQAPPAQAQPAGHSAKAAAAAPTTSGPIQVGGAWARPTVAGQQAGGGYLWLHNSGPADRLLSASTPVAAAVELHTMSMEGDVMRMRQIDAIDLPTDEHVELQPGGRHLMFTGLKRPLKAGERVPLSLRFEKAGVVTVEMPVRAAAEGGAGEGGSGHKH